MDYLLAFNNLGAAVSWLILSLQYIHISDKGSHCSGMIWKVFFAVEWIAKLFIVFAVELTAKLYFAVQGAAKLLSLHCDKLQTFYLCSGISCQVVVFAVEWTA